MDINKEDFLKMSQLKTGSTILKFTKNTQVNYRELPLFRSESLKIGTRYHQR